MGAGAAQAQQPAAQPAPQPVQPEAAQGISPDEVMSPAQRRKLAKLPPSIQEKIRRGELSLDEVLSL